jgi:hypothetical protein
VKLREELGQLSWSTREIAHREALRQTARARRGIRLSGLGRSRRHTGEVWAVSMVKDEADVIGLTVNHLLRQGVDHLLIADNLSRDETRPILDDLARRDPRIHVVTDSEPAYYQAAKMTRLARAAARAGADWVVPFDADELWFADHGSVAERLRAIAATEADHDTTGVVRARLHDTIPTGGPSPDPTTATCVLDVTPTPPGKVAIRAHRLMGVIVGNHGAKRVGRAVDGLRIAHLQYRSEAQVERKARQGLEAVQLADAPDYVGVHWSALAGLTTEGVAETWAGMQRGEPQPEVHYYANGPMVRVRPQAWSTWDPEGIVADAEATAAGQGSET